MKLPAPSEYSKQKTYRNRKKPGSKDRKAQTDMEHPRHKPYEREHKDWSQTYNDDTDAE